MFYLCRQFEIDYSFQLSQNMKNNYRKVHSYQLNWKLNYSIFVAKTKIRKLWFCSENRTSLKKQIKLHLNVGGKVVV